MTELEAAWLAGLLEGEGCFHVRSDDGRPLIKLGMCDEDVVSRAATLMHKSYFRAPAVAENHKDQFVVYLTGPAALNVMRRVLPHMGSRRTAAIVGALGPQHPALFA